MSDENEISQEHPAEENPSAPDAVPGAPEVSVIPDVPTLDVAATVETASATEPVVASDTPTPKGKRRWWVGAAIVVVIAIASAAGIYGYQQSQTRSAAAAKLDEATTMIENADAIVLLVDEAVRAEITTEVGAQAVDLQERVPEAIADIEDAIALLNVAIPDLAQDDIPRAEALKASAEARAEMLSTVDPILEGNVKAASALQPALDAWSAVLEGETIADRAIAEYNKLTEDGVKSSQAMTAEALAKYQEAEELFSTAATGFPEADFSVYVAYVDGKIELLAISKQANDAFLAGDKSKANTLSSQYNTKDKELVELAAKLPETPAEIVASAYEDLAGEATTAYFEARQRATDADKELNDLEG